MDHHHSCTGLKFKTCNTGCFYALTERRRRLNYCFPYSMDDARKIDGRTDGRTAAEEAGEITESFALKGLKSEVWGSLLHYYYIRYKY